MITALLPHGVGLESGQARSRPITTDPARPRLISPVISARQLKIGDILVAVNGQPCAAGGYVRGGAASALRRGGQLLLEIERAVPPAPKAASIGLSTPLVPQRGLIDQPRSTLSEPLVPSHTLAQHRRAQRA